MTCNDVTKMSVNKYEIESEIGVMRSASGEVKSEYEYMNYSLEELLEADLQPH